MPQGRRLYRTLYFGEAAAEAEARKHPEALIDGYYDIAEVSSTVRRGDAFLLVGPKGAGKTCFVEHLQLSNSGPECFVKRQDLGELRGGLKDDSTLSESSLELSELSWSTWLWCQLFDLTVSDHANSLSSSPEAVALQNELRDLGVIGSDFRSVVREVRKKSHAFNIGKLYQYKKEKQGAKRVNLGQLRDVLVDIVCASEGPNRHVLALDGLDSSVIGNDNYWKQLASLLRAATSVHEKIRDIESCDISILMLCRSDIFLKIPLADSNKIRQSWGVEINWSYGSDAAKDSHLWDLIEYKISLGKGFGSDFLHSYFPSEMEHGHRTTLRTQPMADYLMQLTRGTPRDMIMLLRKIQEESRELDRLTIGSIRAGVNKYCSDYFVTEISNELVGMVPAELENTVGSLSRLEYRRFERREIEAIFPEASNRRVLDRLLEQLFLAGAIANVSPGNREDYVQFYHRRNHAQIRLQGPFLLHLALALAMNVHPGRRPRL